VPPVVVLRRADAGMIRHLRRLFQRAAVLQMRRDASRPKAVIAESSRDAGRHRALSYYRSGVRLGQWSATLHS
jgi:hypothetical protein